MCFGLAVGLVPFSMHLGSTCSGVYNEGPVWRPEQRAYDPMGGTGVSVGLIG